MRNTQMKSLLHIPYFMVGFITHQRRLKSKNLKGQSVMESHLMEQVLRLNQAWERKFPPAPRVSTGPEHTVHKFRSKDSGQK